MRILDERVEGYVHDLRPVRSEVLAMLPIGDGVGFAARL
jgi:hypothetical protein